MTFDTFFDEAGTYNKVTADDAENVEDDFDLWLTDSDDD